MLFNRTPQARALSNHRHRLHIDARACGARLNDWIAWIRCVWLFCGLGMLHSLASVSAVAQERGRDLLAAEELFRRGAWAQAEDKFAQVLASTTQGPSSDEKVRSRRRCLLMLAETCRRRGQHSEALGFALQYRDDLKGERDAEFADILQQNAIGIAESQMALGDFSEARATLEELLANRFAKLKDFRKLQVLVTLATVEHLTDRTQPATEHWNEADKLGREFLKRFEKSLSTDEVVSVLLRLVECQQALDRTDPADQMLETLQQRLSRLPEGKPRQLRALLELGTHASLRRDFLHAENHFRQALEFSSPKENPRGAAQIHQLLANAYREQQIRDKAQMELAAAAECLKHVIASAKPDVTSKAPAPGDLKQLRNLYQQLGRIPEAISIGEQLLQIQTAELGPTHPLVMESSSVLGGLYGALGQYGKAKPLLRAVVDHFRQLEKSPTSLARALNNLGAVERGVGEFTLATESFAEALQLREKHLASDDPELATSYNNLASACLVQGQFKRAIQLYQQVLERCRERGPRANGLQSVTLLNLAMAYKSQGQFERAADLCQQSLTLLEETAGRETMASVGHYNALATMARGQRRYAESYRWAEKSLAVCATHQQADHLAAASAHTQIGIVACLGRAYETAESHWQQTLSIQRANQQTASVAFTLNMLGLLAYQQERFADAKQFFENARQLHEDVEVAPQDRYNTLCNLAAVYRKEGQTEKALAALREAIAIPEAFRSETFGEAEQGRAKFLAQFASAFDMQVQWLLEDKDYDAAFVAAEQSRNRTFLDQLNLAGVDLRQTLPNDVAKRLLPREQELRLQLQRLRIQAKLLPEHSNQSPEWQNLSRELNQAQSAYAQTWSEIRDSSQVYSKLLTQERTVWTLDQIRREVIAPDTLVLFYHLGAQQSVVLVIGDQSKSVVAVPLEVTSQQATLLPELPQLSGAASALGQAAGNRVPGEPGGVSPRTTTSVRGLTPSGSPGDSRRGIGGTVETNKGETIEADKEQTEVTSGPLTRRKGADLVAWYRQVLRQKQFDPTRGIGGTVETTKGTAVPTTSFIAVADILFPEQLRKVISERRPKKLVIIPDGALHNLPFEALLVRGGGSPRYVLDEFPPIAYAPSANILVNLVRRTASSPESRRSLLTLGNPQYRAQTDIAETTSETSIAVGTAVAATDRSGELTRDMMYGLRGSLPPLPGTARECARLAECFERRGMTVKTLLDANATEQQFVESVRGRGVVHLAAHGLVDERYGNLFGAIALTPPAEAALTEHNDGLLSYNEILQLKLADCELAVLSACQTNVGPDRPLEAGSTLAQAFLAAGSRRVIASHWSVSDGSTAELIAGFFELIADGLDKTNRLDAAASLHEAKKKIRNDPRWQAPYYWAPFVLLGPSN